MRAFVNMCSIAAHRSVPHGSGTANRFSCPYHAWTYRLDGALAGSIPRT